MCLPCRSPLLSSYSLSSILTHSFSSLFLTPLLTLNIPPKETQRSRTALEHGLVSIIWMRENQRMLAAKGFLCFFSTSSYYYLKKKSISVFYFIFAIGWARFKRIFFVSYLKIFARCCQRIIQGEHYVSVQ